MLLDELIRARYDQCISRLAQLQKKCEKLPSGKIGSFERHGYTYWRYTDENNKRHYLPKAEIKTAQKLALRGIYEAEIKDLNCEIESCRRYLDYYTSHGGWLERKLLKSGTAQKELLSGILLTEDARIKAWEEAPYKKSSSHPENLRISTSQKFMVRSKSEALIAEALFQLNIPARYEQIHTFGSETIATDFTILNPVTHRQQYIEYFGLMDDPEYVERYIFKTAVYTRAGLTPDIEILFFHEKPGARIDMNHIRMRLKDFIFGNV